MTFKDYINESREGRKAPEITCVFVGDIMLHPDQHKAELNRGYSFNGIFDEVKEIFKGSSIVMGNLETTFGRLEKLPKYRSGLFNAPDEFADALKKAGFTHLTLLNNHTFDSGFAGLERTKLVVKNAGIVPIERHAYDNVKGLNVEFLNFTTHYNSAPSSTERTKYSNSEVVSVPSDLKICMPHWGGQYTPEPNKQQIKMGDDLNLKWNVVGSGPHTPHRSIIKNNRILAYSLGDFLSNHQKPGSTDLGKILKVTFKNNKVQSCTEYETSTVTTNGISTIKINKTTELQN